MEKKNYKGWLYLLPAILFLGIFMVYPLVDVFIYSFEEGYNYASQTSYGMGGYNYSYVLHDTYFLQAVKNTFILVIITVPISTGLALLISMGLSSIKPLRNLYQTIYFLPYVTNTLAVGLVFMILFKKTPYSDGMVNVLINFFGGSSVDFIDGPYWAKMFVLCFYTIWVVMPFKVLILTSALASVNPIYYNAAKVDGTSDLKYLWKVMIPLALPTLISITILKMMGAWNSYVWPRLVANDEAYRLITNGLRNAFTESTGDVNIPVQMAAVAIVSFPLFLVFIFLRKYIMKGVSRSGIKG